MVTEERNIGALRRRKGRAVIAHFARKHSASEATLHSWQARYGGMDVTEAKQM